MTRTELLQEVEKVLAHVNEQLKNRRRGMQGPGTPEELSIISKEIAEVANRLAQNNLPVKSERWLSAGQIVSGTWDFEQSLGEEIARISYLYRQELED